MNCKLCDSNNVKRIYNGKIRNGGLGKYSDENISIYQCGECEVIWHANCSMENIDYYESTKYRDSLEGSSDIEQFYRLHDKETMQKFMYTGTDIFRHKVIADIGCGGGSFLDFLSGVAQEIIAIEPTLAYRKIMKNKGYQAYAYAADAKNMWLDKVEVITSFDVIEHVESPLRFIEDAYELLKPGGEAIIGTPTDAPVMRQMLGEIYERKLLYSTQHLWILAEKNLKLLAEKAGFKKIEVKYFQRYGISNLLGWLKEERPCGEPKYSFVTDTLNEVWKSECGAKGLADYIVVYLYK